MVLVQQHLLFLLLILTVFGCCFAECPISTCDPDDPNLQVFRLTTKFSVYEVKGSGTIIYPKMPNGEAFEQAYISYYWRDIIEKLPTPIRPDGGGGQCPPVSEPIQPDTVRYLNLSQSCCSMTIGWEMIAPEINATIVVVNITNPIMPDFVMIVNTTISNDTLEIPRFGGPNIDFLNYTIDYSPKAAKISMSISNWNWSVTEDAGSWLRARLFLRAQLEEPGTVTVRDGLISSAFELLSSRARITFDFFSFYYLDGEEYINQLGARRDPIVIPEQEFVSSEGDFNLGTLTFCLENKPIIQRWTSITYDPSLSALFIPEPSKSKKNNTLAIALGTTGAIVFVVLVVVIIALKSNSFKNLIRPFRNRSKNTDPSMLSKNDSWTSGVKPPTRQ